ncbi:uncharacterized protein METZ01_LOCUS21053 [marine metagenome]|uniref:Uncharacterized protein n=1 Tax=marine metagenome TaxID=408172 RepID=A0A381PQ88_9ZZZZ
MEVVQENIAVRTFWRYLLAKGVY